MPIIRRPRTVLKLSGETLRPWLDKLITNTLSGPVSFAALLTPQGKIIADFFVTENGDDLLLDTTEAMGPALLKRLKMFRLREPIEIEDVSETNHVYCAWDNAADKIGDPDPRMASLGSRLITTERRDVTPAADYDAHRLSLGVTDSQWDFGPISTFPMDACMDQLNGVDYQKGCFVGQEVVSRMKRMSSVRKRMRSVVLSGPADPGDAIKAGERKVGQLLHVNGTLGMALIRIDRLKEATESPSVRGNRVQVMGSVIGTDD
jgi:folate-binding protein YgfZ